MEDEKLVKLIEKNPNKGIHCAMQQYGKAINTICCSILQGCEEGTVDEAVSETFFKLWKNIKQFSPEKGTSLKSWLYSVARNTAIDLRRKNTVSVFYLNDGMEMESTESVEREIQKKELKNVLEEVIDLLGEPDNRVFLCKYFLCMKNKEIAKSLNLPEKKIENILYRGKGKLKGLLIERGITGYEEG